MAFFISYSITALQGNDISPRADRLKGSVKYERSLIKDMI